MHRTEAAALFYLSSLPPSMRNRVLDESDFQKDVGINGRTVRCGAAGPMRLGELLDAVRKVYETRRQQVVRNMEGNEVQICYDEGRAAITRIGDNACETKLTRFEFALLCPDRQTRLEEFRAILHTFGVTGPAPACWEPILEYRPLSNTEIVEIHDAIRRSVPNWELTTQAKISTRSLTQADLVPPLAEYFTAFCGPLPGDVGVDEYIRGPLTNHRQELIARNMSEGLSLLLPGYLRLDAAVAPLLSRFTDDEIWKAVEPLKGVSDPFTLLGLLEIALARRTTKSEFEDLASDLVEKLCGETLNRRDGSDIYDFFPTLVKVSLHHLRHLDGMMMQPPYWHRLCAFTHAGLLARLMDGLQFDPKAMVQWLDTAGHVSDGLADILALRSEPTWHFGHLTREHIQAEIIGRLKELAHNEENEGRQFPYCEILNRRIKSFLAQGISPFSPGPLEGGCRPIDHKTERTLPDETVSALIAKLNDTSGEFPWAWVDNLSAEFCFPDRLRNSLTERLKTIELPEEPFANRMDLLSSAGLIAAMHKDRDMAELIAEKLFREFDGDKDIQPVFVALLVASTAIDETEWIDWLKAKLYRLALEAPSTCPLETLGILIDELKPLLPISQWRFGQVEALCKMGLKYQSNQVTL